MPVVILAILPFRFNTRLYFIVLLTSCIANATLIANITPVGSYSPYLRRNTNGLERTTVEQRVKDNDFHDFEVDVQDLRRAMDFRNLGTKDVRRAEAVHLYVDVPNFHLAVNDAGNDKQKQRKLVRAASVLRKVQGDLLKEDEIGDIQRQTVRLHALAYKPYDSDDESHESDRVEQAVIHAITHNTYVLEVFNDVFKDVRNFSSAVGLASGTSYIANIGKHGNRELISLGSCANLAAKILGGRDTITITSAMYDLLPDCLKKHFQKASEIAGVQTYQATGLRWSSHPELAKELGVTWDEEKWRKKTEELQGRVAP